MLSADSVNFSNFLFLDACFSVMTICLNTVWTRGAVFHVIVGSTLHVPGFAYLHPLYKWPEGINRHAICSWKGELLLLFSTSVPLTFVSQNLRSSPSVGFITLHYYPREGGGWPVADPGEGPPLFFDQNEGRKKFFGRHCPPACALIWRSGSATGDSYNGLYGKFRTKCVPFSGLRYMKG